MRVVLFSGGRGSEALASTLVANPRVDLTVAINGYDDGASTGEVRRFLGDAVGPSDFRKNAARLLRTASGPLIDLLDLRLPESANASITGASLAAAIRTALPGEPGLEPLRAAAAAVSETSRGEIAARLDRFARELDASAKPFRFGDCSLGNLVFAGRGPVAVDARVSDSSQYAEVP